MEQVINDMNVQKAIALHIRRGNIVDEKAGLRCFRFGKLLKSMKMKKSPLRMMRSTVEGFSRRYFPEEEYFEYIDTVPHDQPVAVFSDGVALRQTFEERNEIAWLMCIRRLARGECHPLSVTWRNF